MSLLLFNSVIPKISAILFEYKWVILFYSLIVIWIYNNRKKFEFQAKIIALYKTKIGIKFIEKIGSKYRELIRLIGYIGVGFAVFGMFFVSYTLVQAFYDLIFRPELPPAFGLVIPGVKIPGAPIFVPFWFGIISLFIVTLVHEFSHGIVAKAYNLDIKSTGIAFFGPLIGAFVEPEEEQLKNEKDIVQYSIFSAGPISNILLGVLVVVILTIVLNPLLNSMIVPIGYSFDNLNASYPAYQAGVTSDTLYNIVNSKKVDSAEEFMYEIELLRVNETVMIGNENVTYSFLAAPHPDDQRKGFLGVYGVNTEYRILDKPLIRFFYPILEWISELLKWIFMLSMGIGLANLLPLGPVDGGRILQVALRKLKGDNKKGDDLWKKISFIALFFILAAVFVPLLKNIIMAVLDMLIRFK
ncbi:site-2 protease family protein [Candidatus Woesearchaeota archaeon]|nr:site-2 protease family protein [Candidatus Woesearchaeota archaeon]